LYREAKLVHGDLSEYNIFILPDNRIVLIDLSQALHVDQPLSHQLLLRDLTNITRYFKKNGLEVGEPSKLFEEITGNAPEYYGLVGV
ncbi:MAG: RIO1 family regulatory kinase/ATPase, partial [Nitrososphaerota archaeon]